MDNDPAKANQGHEQIIVAYKILKKLDPTLSDLKSFLVHHSTAVKLAAATQLLAIDEKAAMPVLEEIDKKKGRLALTAHMVIQQWEKGESHLD